MNVTAHDIASAALEELFERSYALNTPEYSRVERDPNAQIPTQEPGSHAYVLTRSAPLGTAVPLDQMIDISFHVQTTYLRAAIDAFRHHYLTVAMDRVATKLDAARDVASNADRERIGVGVLGNPIVFASAPLPVSDGSAVATCGGVSLRASLTYDIGRASMLVAVDMLFGLRVVEALL